MLPLDSDLVSCMCRVRAASLIDVVFFLMRVGDWEDRLAVRYSPPEMASGRLSSPVLCPSTAPMRSVAMSPLVTSSNSTMPLTSALVVADETRFLMLYSGKATRMCVPGVV